MARVLKKKELVRSRLLKEYASWIYCTSCNQTVAYLCYVTYDAFDFAYTCTCGSKGEVHLAFDEIQDRQTSDAPLVPVKNRQCCPADQSPLVSFVEKNLESYTCEVVCKACATRYKISRR